MYREKTFLAIIPARSGSKGLRHKNIKLLNNKPMMAYTIEAAARSQVFDEVIVSTDNEHYAEIARQYGATVPMLRPKQLAQDQTTTAQVITYTVEELEKQGKQYDYIMILQPTSPLRDDKDIIGSIELLFEKNANAIVSMCEVDHPLKWTAELNQKLCLDGLFSSAPSRRQEEKASYRLNGAIYLANVNYYLQDKDFYKKDCYAYIMTKHHSIDIDDICDFKYAQIIMNEHA